jgi:serine/threonine protein kinase
VRFEFLQKLGEGKTGVVYKARDTETGAIVAVKQLRPLPPGSEFPKDEVLLARKVTHSNVCRINELFREEKDGRFYISMEYIDGESLRSRIARDGALPVHEVLRIGEQMLEGLAAAHREGVVHRDLKPENIMVTAEGVVKIVDFGVARPINLEGTQTEGISGTPGYMAPELLFRRADAQSDLYAMGCVLYEMLSGSRPSGQSPEPLPPDVPAGVQAAISICLNKDSRRRFASAAEFQDALKNSAVPAIRGRGYRRWAGMLAVALFITVLLVTLAAVVLRPPRGSAAASTSDGRYFLRNELPAEALAEFDRVLTSDANDVEALFYRGLALEKLHRWDDAISSFKKALPRSNPDPRAAWNWPAPFAPGLQHAVIVGTDVSQRHLQRDVFDADGFRTRSQKHVIYAERRDKSTVLFFPNLARHGAERLELNDNKVLLNDVTMANERATVFVSLDNSTHQLDTIRLYAVSAADHSLLWHKDIADLGGQPPMLGVAGSGFTVYSPKQRRLRLYDDRTGQLRWTREPLDLERADPPARVRTRAYGDLLIAKSPGEYHAIRLSNGKDAWSAAVSGSASYLVADRGLIVFEPESRLFIIDPETGKMRMDVPVQLVAETKLLSNNLGTTVVTTAVLDGNSLYVLSKALDLYAIDVDAGRLQWRIPIRKAVSSLRAQGGHVYAGTDTGDVIIMDAATGTIAGVTSLDSRPVHVGLCRCRFDCRERREGDLWAASRWEKNLGIPGEFPAERHQLSQGRRAGANVCHASFGARCADGDASLATCRQTGPPDIHAERGTLHSRGQRREGVRHRSSFTACRHERDSGRARRRIACKRECG